MSHETRTSPPTYPEVLNIHDGAFSESIWGSDGFRTIKVSGQDDVIADSYKDDLTITAGTNVTLTTNEDNDTLTIAATPGTVYTAGTGIDVTGTTISVTSLAVTNVHEAANQTAHLALTTQEGDVVVRTDENKSYVKNAGTAGSMSDWTLLRTPTDVVLSVAGNTGAVTAAQLKTAYESNSDTNAFTDADHTKLDGIEASATADQTDEEIQDIVGGMLTGNTETGITVTYEDGDGTIDFVVASQTANDFTNTLKTKLDGIEASATADQTNAEIRTAVEAASDSNVFTDADHTKLNAIEASADVTDTTNVTSAGAVMKTTVDALGDLLVASADNTVTRLARGTDGYILKSNSSTGTGLEWAAAGSGGDVNQNAFSTVAVSGQDNVAADSTTDTLTLAAGSNVTLTTNATSDTVTIAASNTDSTKMPLAGGTFTGDVKINDGEEIRVGSDADLIIVHNGTDGFIKETTGTLDIRAKNTSGGLVTISDSAGENLIKCTAGSSVELTYDGTTKFATTTDGWKSADGVKGTFGTGDDLQIYHDGSNSYIDEGGDGALLIRGDGLQLQRPNGNTYVKCIAGNTVELYFDNNKKAETVTGGFTVTGTCTATAFAGDGSNLTGISGSGASTGETYVKLKNDSGAASDTGINTYAGYNAGAALASGSEDDTLYGYQAGDAITTARYTTAIGSKALSALQTTHGNTAVGALAAMSTTAANNTAVGAHSLYDNVSGQENTAIGHAALLNVEASSNTGIGYYAGDNITTGTNNIVIGKSADASAADVSNEITLGDTNITKFRIPGLNFSIKDSTATDNYVLTVDSNGDAGWEAASGGGASTGETYVKYKNGSGAAANDGTNTYAGYLAGEDLASGANNNTLYGYQAGKDITTGDHSTAIGKDALKEVTSAYGNMGIGYNAGKSLTTGQQNTCIGLGAGSVLVGHTQNVCVGEDAMGQNKGSYNTSVGFQSMALADYGDYNVAVGLGTLKTVGGSSDGSGGDYNVAIGYQAGDALETGNNNIIIGKNADATSDSTSNEITLGNTDITKFRIPGINFVLKDNGGTPSDGQVLTADGNGEASWDTQVAAQPAAGYTYVELKDGGTLAVNGMNTSAGYNAGEYLASGGDQNTFYGYYAGYAVSTGDRNVCIGKEAGKTLSTGSDTVIIGYRAGRVNTASNTVAIGSQALKNLTSGTGNTGIGYNALNEAIENQDCTALGYYALRLNSTGSSNTAVGHGAGENVTSGENNTILGESAGDALTTGDNNIIIGHDAAASAVGVSNEITLGNTDITKFRIPGINFVIKDTTATDNYVLTVDSNGEAGWEAASGGTSAGETYVKLYSGASLSATGNTTAGGYRAGESLASGSSENTFYGVEAGKSVTSGDANTFIGGKCAESVTTQSNNTCIGRDCFKNAASGSNVAIGNTALMEADTGGHVAVGVNALKNTNPSWGGSVAVGYLALEDNTSGYNLTAVGKHALRNNTSGLSNGAFGLEALNTCTTGAGNNAFGYYALYTSNSSYCTAMGHGAGSSVSSGNSNTCFGYSAGNTINTGANNTCIGHNTQASAVDASNEITLGDSSVSTLRCQVTSISSLSDKRDKTDINTLDLGLDFINELKPVKFKWQSREGLAKDGTYEAGFIAQDFQQVQKDNDADYLQMVLESNPDKLEAAPGKLIPILVRAVQELSTELNTLKNTLNNG